jgi:hypothetical protein
VVQRFAKERCREPAALDGFVATVMGRSLRACQSWPCGVSAAPWTRYRCAETTQSAYGRHLGSVRIIVLFVPHAAAVPVPALASGRLGRRQLGAVTMVITAVYPDLIAVGGVPNPVGLSGAAGEVLRRLGSSPAPVLVALALLFCSAGAPLLRFRRARGIERQQLKWRSCATGCTTLTG